MKKVYILLGLLLGLFLMDGISYGFKPVLLARWSRGTTDNVATPVEIWMSLDGGTVWTLRGSPVSIYTTGDAGLGLGASPRENLYLVAACKNTEGLPFTGTKIYFSADTGKTWEERDSINTDGEYDEISAGIAVWNDSLIYMYVIGMPSSSEIKVYKSTDEAKNWSLMATIAIPGSESDPEGEMTYDHLGNFYITDWVAGGTSPFCYFADISGTPWTQRGNISSDPSNSNSRSTSITALADGTLFSTVWSNLCNLKVYKSTDKGWNWSYVTTILNLNSQEDGTASIGAEKDGSLYVGGWDLSNPTYIWRSDDWGINWTQVGTIPGTPHQQTAVLSFACFKPAAAGISESPAETPVTPFVHTIKQKDNRWIFYYTLNTQETIDLSIYDISGRLVIPLVSEMQGKGEYQVEWKGIDLMGKKVSPGLYFYRFQVGKSVVPGKLLMLKNN